jgi:hypothetical protein
MTILISPHQSMYDGIIFSNHQKFTLFDTQFLALCQVDNLTRHVICDPPAQNHEKPGRFVNGMTYIDQPVSLESLGQAQQSPSDMRMHILTPLPFIVSFSLSSLLLASALICDFQQYKVLRSLPKFFGCECCLICISLATEWRPEHISPQYNLSDKSFSQVYVAP